MKSTIFYFVFTFFIINNIYSNDIQIIIIDYPKTINLNNKKLQVSIKVTNESNMDYILKGFKCFDYFEYVNCVDYSDSFEGQPEVFFALIDNNGRSVEHPIPMRFTLTLKDTIESNKEFEKIRKRRDICAKSDIYIKAKETLVIDGIIDLEYVNLQLGNYKFKAMYFNKINPNESNENVWVGCTSSNIVTISVVK